MASSSWPLVVNTQVGPLEVRNDIDGHGQVEDESRKCCLSPPDDAGVGEKALEQHDAVWNGTRHGAGLAAATCENERRDERDVAR